MEHNISVQNSENSHFTHFVINILNQTEEPLLGMQSCLFNVTYFMT